MSQDPLRLRALGVSEESADKVVENTALDARRLGLVTHGGHVGMAFPVEWAAMRAYPEQWPLDGGRSKQSCCCWRWLFPQTFLSTAPLLCHPTKNPSFVFAPNRAKSEADTVSVLVISFRAAISKRR
jgi:hypothetical protein